ncbi:MAG: hypothetical protein AAGC71_11540 [Pseudomonadota bacterium]
MRLRLVAAVVIVVAVLIALVTMRCCPRDPHTVAPETSAPNIQVRPSTPVSTLQRTTAVETAAHRHSAPTGSRCDYPLLEDWVEPKALEQVRQAILATLSESEDSDSLAAAAMLLKFTDASQRTSLDMIDRAIAQSPVDPVLRMLAYDLCRRSPPDDVTRSCLDSERRQRLLDWVERDRGNGAAWAELALTDFLAGDTNRGLTALAEAASATHTSTYFVELVERSEIALHGAGMPFPDSAGYGFAFAAGVASVGLTQYCQDNAPNDALLRQHCFGYYELLANTSNTLIGQSIGLALQVRLTVDDPSRAEQHAELEERQRHLTTRMDAAFAAMRAHERWMLSDRSRFYAQINTWRASDELTALEDSRERRLRHERAFNCTFSD